MDGAGMNEGERAAASLGPWVEEHYDIAPPMRASLLRSHTNDVYAIETGDRGLILKVYGARWRTEAEVDYEMALLEHLTRRGVAVAEAIPGRDGRVVRHLGTLDTPAGPRLAVVFERAAGAKPNPPLAPELYVPFGRAMAAMHSAADDFVGPPGRIALDLATVVDEPVEQAMSLLTDPEDRADLDRIARSVRRAMDPLIRAGLDDGPIHGDATFDNLHLTPDGEVVLFDFDSGGPGWRAADLQGWAAGREEYADRWDAFRAGYSEVRELRDVDLEAAPHLAMAWLIWGLKIDLDNRILARGADAVRSYLAMQLDAIRSESASR